MASRVSNFAPRSTEWLACTAMPEIMPAVGAGTWPASAGSAFGGAGSTTGRERSRTFTSRGWPFSSKKSVRVPSGCGSLEVRNFTISVFPCSISMVDRKSTRLNSSHDQISYAVFCLKKKKTHLNSSHDQNSHSRVSLDLQFGTEM